MFLYPVFRDKGYMTLVSQFQETCFLLTFLEDFRRNPQVKQSVKGSRRGEAFVGWQSIANRLLVVGWDGRV